PQKNQRDVEDRLRAALDMDRARVQVGKLSRFGLLEMSRQRLRPSLGESTQVVCPQCEGEGRIRGIESLSLSVLRLIEEEAMKERTARVVAKLPVNVATFLLNEKRGIISEIEKRCQVSVVLVPNPHLDMPKYDIQRVRDDEARAPGAGSASYKLVTAPEPEPLPSSERAKEAAEAPAVKGINPSMPAPVFASETAEQQPGIFVKLWRALFGTGEKKRSSERSHREQRGSRPDFQRRDRNDRDRGRGRDRDRNRSRDERGDRDRNRQQAQQQGQGGGQPSQKREERGERSDRGQQQGRERGDRQERQGRDRNERGERQGRDRNDRGGRDRDRDRNRQQQQQPAPQQQAQPASAPMPSPAPAADAVEAQPVIASQPTMTEAAVSEQAQHEQIAQQGTQGHGQHGERHAEGGPRRGRRRGRRGGRRRRFEGERGAEQGGSGNPNQQNADPNDDNRGNVAAPGEQYYRDLTERDHDGEDQSHAHDVHSHAHVAAPTEPRQEYHEPASAAEHDDRTMPEPSRIPEAVPRHDQNEGNGGGGNEGGDGGHHE
ncbi:MAG TPA: ribonuclease E/G, partial [Gammaproteobacteria bacterium]|nr:ribonuclease E/G [Gammaproteobacteria bacterium]